MDCLEINRKWNGRHLKVFIYGIVRTHSMMSIYANVLSIIDITQIKQ